MTAEVQTILATDLARSKNPKVRELFLNQLILSIPEARNPADQGFNRFLNRSNGKNRTLEVCRSFPVSSENLTQILDQNDALKVDRQLFEKRSEALECFLHELIVKGFRSQVDLKYKLQIRIYQDKNDQWCCKVIYQDLVLHSNKGVREIKGSIEADFHYIPAVGFKFDKITATALPLVSPMFSNREVEINKEPECKREQPEASFLRVYSARYSDASSDLDSDSELKRFASQVEKKINKPEVSKDFFRSESREGGFGVWYIAGEPLPEVSPGLRDTSLGNSRERERIVGAYIRKFIENQIPKTYQEEHGGAQAIEDWIWANAAEASKDGLYVSTHQVNALMENCEDLSACHDLLKIETAACSTPCVVGYSEFKGLFVEQLFSQPIRKASAQSHQGSTGKFVQLLLRVTPASNCNEPLAAERKIDLIHSLSPELAEKSYFTVTFKNLGMKRNPTAEKAINTASKQLATKTIGKKSDKETEAVWLLRFEKQYLRRACLEKIKPLLVELHLKRKEALDKVPGIFLDNYNETGEVRSNKCRKKYKLLDEYFTGKEALVVKCLSLAKKSTMDECREPILDHVWDDFVTRLTQIEAKFPAFIEIWGKDARGFYSGIAKTEKISVFHGKLKQLLGEVKRLPSFALHQSIIEGAWSCNLTEAEKNRALDKLSENINKLPQEVYQKTLQKHGGDRREVAKDIIAKRCVGDLSLLPLFFQNTRVTRELILSLQKRRVRIDMFLPKAVYPIPSKENKYSKPGLKGLIENYYTYALTLTNAERQEKVKNILALLNACFDRPEKLSFELYHEVFPKIADVFKNELEDLQQIVRLREENPLFNFDILRDHDVGIPRAEKNWKARQSFAEETQKFVAREEAWQRLKRQEPGKIFGTPEETLAKVEQLANRADFDNAVYAAIEALVASALVDKHDIPITPAAKQTMLDSNSKVIADCNRRNKSIPMLPVIKIRLMFCDAGDKSSHFSVKGNAQSSVYYAYLIVESLRLIKKHQDKYGENAEAHHHAILNFIDAVSKRKTAGSLLRKNIKLFLKDRPRVKGVKFDLELTRQLEALREKLYTEHKRCQQVLARKNKKFTKLSQSKESSVLNVVVVSDNHKNLCEDIEVKRNDFLRRIKTAESREELRGAVEDGEKYFENHPDREKSSAIKDECKKAILAIQLRGFEVLEKIEKTLKASRDRTLKTIKAEFEEEARNLFFQEAELPEPPFQREFDIKEILQLGEFSVSDSRKLKEFDTRKKAQIKELAVRREAQLTGVWKARESAETVDLEGWAITQSKRQLDWDRERLHGKSSKNMAKFERYFKKHKAIIAKDPTKTFALGDSLKQLSSDDAAKAVFDALRADAEKDLEIIDVFLEYVETFDVESQAANKKVIDQVKTYKKEAILKKHLDLYLSSAPKYFSSMANEVFEGRREKEVYFKELKAAILEDTNAILSRSELPEDQACEVALPYLKYIELKRKETEWELSVKELARKKKEAFSWKGISKEQAAKRAAEETVKDGLAGKKGFITSLKKHGVEGGSDTEKTIYEIYEQLAKETIGEKPIGESITKWQQRFEKHFLRFACLEKAKLLLRVLRISEEQAHKENRERFEALGKVRVYQPEEYEKREHFLSDYLGDRGLVARCSVLIAKLTEDEYHGPVIDSDWDTFVTDLIQIEEKLPEFIKIWEEQSSAKADDAVLNLPGKLEQVVAEAKDLHLSALSQSIFKRVWSHTLTKAKQNRVLDEVVKNLEKLPEKELQKMLQKHEGDRREIARDIITTESASDLSLLPLFSQKTRVTRPLIASLQKVYARLDVFLPKAICPLSLGESESSLKDLIENYYTYALTLTNAQRQEKVKSVLERLNACLDQPEQLSFAVYQEVFPKIADAFKKELEDLQQLARLREAHPLFNFEILRDWDVGIPTEYSAKELSKNVAKMHWRARQSFTEEGKKFRAREEAWQRLKRQKPGRVFNSQKGISTEVDRLVEQAKADTAVFDSMMEVVASVLVDGHNIPITLAAKQTMLDRNRNIREDCERRNKSPLGLPVIKIRLMFCDTGDRSSHLSVKENAQSSVYYVYLIAESLRLIKAHQEKYGESPENHLHATLNFIDAVSKRKLAGSSLRKNIKHFLKGRPRVKGVKFDLELTKQLKTLREKLYAEHKRCQRVLAQAYVRDSRRFRKYKKYKKLSLLKENSVLNAVVPSDSNQKICETIETKKNDFLKQVKKVEGRKKMLEVLKESAEHFGGLLSEEAPNVVKAECKKAIRAIQFRGAEKLEKLGVLEEKLRSEMLEALDQKFPGILPEKHKKSGRDVSVHDKEANWVTNYRFKLKNDDVKTIEKEVKERFQRELDIGRTHQLKLQFEKLLPLEETSALNAAAPSDSDQKAACGDVIEEENSKELPEEEEVVLAVQSGEVEKPEKLSDVMKKRNDFLEQIEEAKTSKKVFEVAKWGTEYFKSFSKKKGIKEKTVVEAEREEAIVAIQSKRNEKLEELRRELEKELWREMLEAFGQKFPEISNVHNKAGSWVTDYSFESEQHDDVNEAIKTEVKESFQHELVTWTVNQLKLLLDQTLKSLRDESSKNMATLEKELKDLKKLAAKDPKNINKSFPAAQKGFGFDGPVEALFEKMEEQVEKEIALIDGFLKHVKTLSVTLQKVNRVTVDQVGLYKWKAQTRKNKITLRKDLERFIFVADSIFFSVTNEFLEGREKKKRFGELKKAMLEDVSAILKRSGLPESQANEIAKPYLEQIKLKEKETELKLSVKVLARKKMKKHSRRETVGIRNNALEERIEELGRELEELLEEEGKPERLSDSTDLIVDTHILNMMENNLSDLNRLSLEKERSAEREDESFKMTNRIQRLGEKLNQPKKSTSNFQNRIAPEGGRKRKLEELREHERKRLEERLKRFDELLEEELFVEEDLKQLSDKRENLREKLEKGEELSLEKFVEKAQLEQERLKELVKRLEELISDTNERFTFMAREILEGRKNTEDLDRLEELMLAKIENEVTCALSGGSNGHFSEELFNEIVKSPLEHIKLQKQKIEARLFAVKSVLKESSGSKANAGVHGASMHSNMHTLMPDREKIFKAVSYDESCKGGRGKERLIVLSTNDADLSDFSR